MKPPDRAPGRFPRGDPNSLGSLYAQLVKTLPDLNVFGGCCGTDHRHVEAICRAVVSNN